RLWPREPARRLVVGAHAAVRSLLAQRGEHGRALRRRGLRRCHRGRPSRRGSACAFLPRARRSSRASRAPKADGRDRTRAQSVADEQDLRHGATRTDHPQADPETLAETAAWLWQFGPTPLVAVVGTEKAIPGWLTAWSPRVMKWAPAGSKLGCAVVLTEQADLERFLREGVPHEHTVLMWPRVSPAKTFEALAVGGTEWKVTVDA